MAFETTVVSYPDRGKWGDKSWAGNTSGWLVKDFIESYGVTFLYDPMEGSGTSREVAADLGVRYAGTDIHSGYDLTSKAVRARIVREFFADEYPDGVFWHPPYWDIVKYSAHSSDLSRASTYPQFLAMARDILLWLGSIVRPGGVLGVLTGDARIKSRSSTAFITDDLLSAENVRAAKLVKEIRVIKIQHNTKSGGDINYPIRLVHEYFTILRKPQ
jgi:hypothetical protein